MQKLKPDINEKAPLAGTGEAIKILVFPTLSLCYPRQPRREGGFMYKASIKITHCKDLINILSLRSGLTENELLEIVKIYVASDTGQTPFPFFYLWLQEDRWKEWQDDHAVWDKQTKTEEKPSEWDDPLLLK